MTADSVIVEVKDLSIGYESRTVLESLNFQVKRGEIFGFLGGSGCGKSTLLKNIIGLYEPLAGDISVFGESLINATQREKRALMQRFGVTYQSGALLGSLTLLENVCLPLEEYTKFKRSKIREIAMSKLDLVGLADYCNYMPSELSGGMVKRGGLARALSLEPELLFFDEPSAGLDPISSAELDQLILAMRAKHNTTIIIVTHELESIFSVVDRVIVLDKKSKSIIDSGDPRELRVRSKHPWVKQFLTRDGMTIENYKTRS